MSGELNEVGKGSGGAGNDTSDWVNCRRSRWGSLWDE